MVDFIREITLGQGFLLWAIGTLIAHMTTGFKDGMEGLLGIVVYVLITCIAAMLYGLIVLWQWLGQ